VNETLGRFSPETFREWAEKYPARREHYLRRAEEAERERDNECPLTKDPFSCLLAHLHRAGAYSYWWIAEGRKSDWWPVNSPSPIPTGRKNVYFGVHSVTQIPPTNSKGEEKPPEAVRSQIQYIERRGLSLLLATGRALHPGHRREARASQASPRSLGYVRGER
jgi:hypothetical protein